MDNNGGESDCIQSDPDSTVQERIENVQIQRMESVSGWEARVNDIIYCPPEKQTQSIPPKSTEMVKEITVVYFGGDVQDYAENMEKQRDGKKYIDWNLENTALLLHKKFPTAHIVVIKPSRMEYLTFSCFKNFVNSNDFGIPAHCPNYFAIQHLQSLLQHLKNRISNVTKVETVNYEIVSKAAEVEKDENDLILIGFSKGCVVLNQLMSEFHFRHCELDSSQTGPSHSQLFRSRIREMYWLDGGHSGGRNTWIINKPILKTLAEMEATLHVHVTPYQVEDERRPWIRKEERIFSDTLTRYGATLHRTLHFADCTNVDISTHFNVLNAFKPDIIGNDSNI